MSSFFGSMRRSPFRRSMSSSTPDSSVKNGNERQDIDIYCLRRIPKNLGDYDLEQKIELELKMQEGTKKLLAACRYPLQALEAAKSLLTSGERVNVYAFELQRKKTLNSNRANNRFAQTVTLPSKGKVAITDIRMPLMWKDSDHFKNRGDYRRFAVFCLLKLGAEVHDTAIVNNVDRSMTDIAFEDVVVFNHVPHDFDFRLEVYSYVLHEDLTIASASNKLKKKISYSVSKAIGKKLAANMKDDLNNKGSMPEIELVAHANLRLEDANTRIKTYDLTTENNEKSRHQLPLFGHFCCRMAVQPECMAEEVYSGYLSLVQQIGNITGSRRMWSCLKNFSLSMWVNSAEIHTSKADLVIPVKQNTKVITEENPTSYPKFSFRIGNMIEEEKKEFLLAADTPTELSTWSNHIHQHIKDFDLWKPASSAVVDIPSPSARRHTQFLKNRNSSLYDETPFMEGEDSLSPVFHSSPYYPSNRLSTPALRSWSSSSSSTSSVDLQQHQVAKAMNRRPASAHFSF